MFDSILECCFLCYLFDDATSGKNGDALDFLKDMLVTERSWNSPHLANGHLVHESWPKHLGEKRRDWFESLRLKDQIEKGGGEDNGNGPKNPFTYT